VGGVGQSQSNRKDVFLDEIAIITWVKPFLLVSTRASDQAAAAEQRAVAQAMGLALADVVQLRLERDPLPADFSGRDWSGVILGGSDFCVSSEAKPPAQLRAETDLARLLDDVLALDLPFLGLCYGVSVLADRLGEVVDQTYGEDVGAIAVHLTAAGRADPLLQGLPDPFQAYVGHKEAARRLPVGAVLLASGADCPIQMLRLGNNVYATQFHPELDTPGLIERMVIYRHDGYFDPADFDRIAQAARASGVDGSQTLVLRRFAERYGGAGEKP